MLSINQFLSLLKKIINYSKWTIFGILCVSIGFYPIIYFLIDRHFGLLASKTPEVLGDLFWNMGFYGHIVPGGLALLIGWLQFSKKIRFRKPQIHRAIGKTYVFAVLISGLCGLYIAQFGTGGVSNRIGFSLSALFWLGSTILAFNAIKNGKIQIHQEFMIYSYAICFSAVTLRFWLPLLMTLTNDFNYSYKIVGWLSWVPNILIAYLIIQRQRKAQKMDQSFV